MLTKLIKVTTLPNDNAAKQQYVLYELQQTKVYNKMAYDKDLAKRFLIFRKKYIGSQVEAAELLGVSQKHISAMETGKSSIGLDIVRTLMKKKQMNPTWFLSGVGTHRIDIKSESKLIHDVSELKADMELMMATIKDIQGNMRMLAGAMKTDISKADRLK